MDLLIIIVFRTIMESSYQQQVLIKKVLEILHNEQLARLAFTGVCVTVIIHVHLCIVHNNNCCLRYQNILLKEG